jgi:hypothetical protein
MHTEYPAIYTPRRLRRGRVTGHDFDAIAPWLRTRVYSSRLRWQTSRPRVELTKAATGEHKGVRLRYRPEYIPVREEPEWDIDLFSGTTVVQFRMQGRAFASVGSSYWLRLTAATFFRRFKRQAPLVSCFRCPKTTARCCDLTLTPNQAKMKFDYLARRSSICSGHSD